MNVSWFVLCRSNKCGWETCYEKCPAGKLNQYGPMVINVRDDVVK